MRKQSSVMYRALAGICALASIGACSLDTTYDSGFESGRVVVTVVDQSNAGIPNVRVDLLTAASSSIWRFGTTGSDGKVEIGQSEAGVLTGNYLVRVQLPANYGLAAGQAALVPVTVSNGQTSNITIRLQRTSPPQ